MTSCTARAPRPVTSMPESYPGVMNSPLVAVVMGSDSDWSVMQNAATALDELGISYEVEVLSAHRTPDAMIAYGRAAAGRGIRVIIAGAGGAAHLPGMIASVTTLPVVGVPVPLATLDGLDSLLSIVQMPAGIPVATVSIGGGRNAGLLAARIIGSTDAAVAERLAAFAAALEHAVAQKNAALKASIGAASSS
ncbi:MAG: phosphoribosylaminoimidazole carboxylase catalytic subunit [Actinomycetota bacterium]